MENENTICLMFERPSEPLFMPKGEEGSVIFEIPDNFYRSRQRKVKDKLKKRFKVKGATTITIENISIPDLTVPLSLGRSDNFSLFLYKHRDIAGKLIDILMQPRSVKDLTSLAAYCRDRLNPYLFNYAMSVTLLHRPDTKNVPIPNFLSCFPGKFVESKYISQARQEAVIIPQESRQPIVIPQQFTANDREPEQAVAYFREDIGINLHHWHWHLVYPFTSSDRSIVAKDRRGELFYYMHHQMLARYDAERFSNGMASVTSYNIFQDTIKEAYFPKLNVAIANRAWPPRFVDTPVSDIDRPLDQFTLKLDVLKYWLGNIQEAIQNRSLVDAEGNVIALDDIKGIDILGNVIEASILSPNSQLFGDLHNMGHIFISFSHDPQGKFLESFAVMGDTATAMRDPVFYRWHRFLDDLFILHKNSLPTYDVENLIYPNITVTAVNVEVPGKVPNELYTFWEQSDVDMSRGLDFSPRGPLFVRLTHLQNETFAYTITVNNAGASQVNGTVRIFMVPKTDEQGRELTFAEQRLLMIEMDKFKATLVQGDNAITRRSDQSSVTIPYERTYRGLNYQPENSDEEAQINFCGCGWPQNMLIPKGKPSGMPFYLFVMVSDYEKDSIVQEAPGVCDSAYSYCGMQNKLYPDKRSMGYPFDRVGRAGVATLGDFLTPNMRTQEVRIIFSDRIVVREQRDLNAQTPSAVSAKNAK